MYHKFWNNELDQFTTTKTTTATLVVHTEVIWPQLNQILLINTTSLKDKDKPSV